MSRRAMTLVEMLVATTATLILMAAVAQAFAVFGSAISGSRGVLDLDARMRSAAWRLRSDLSGITVSPLPPIKPESAQGYLEIIEGPLSDYQDASNGSAALFGGTAVGPTDIDDVLLFTTRNTETPFIGRGPSSGTFESTVAEVAWFARPTPGSANPPTYTLYRKQLLVMGYVGAEPFHTNATSTNSIPYPGTWSTYFEQPCDVSVRLENGHLVPNTLADLGRRETRFLHGGAFPHVFAGANGSVPDGLVFSSGPGAARGGEDVVLADVIAFDVRVFDPAVAVRQDGTTPLVPSDPSYPDGDDIGTGAYVDLGHGINATSSLTGITPRFYAAERQVAGTVPSLRLTRTYDTWTLAYEANGINEDNLHGPDQAINGLDDSVPGIDDNNNGQIDELDEPGNGLIDDPAEFETRPPYPYPLRGIEVRIRCYEPSSRQVRQVTVRHSFVPH
jgi:hypothetical protein